MHLKLEIRRNSDGVVTSQIWPDWGCRETYWFEEGNACCDCNREDWFLRAQGIDTENHEVQCSKGNFSVRCSDATTGEVFYDEFEKEKKPCA